jgi:ketosteroid isomerase-like protein
MKTLLLVGMAMAFASIAMGQETHKKSKGTAEAQIMRLEDEWVVSRANKDAAATKALLADDYLGAGVSGQSQTKQQFVDLVSAGQFAGKPDVSDRKVRIYGGTAVSTGLVTGVGQNPSDKVRYIRVYVKRNNQWRLVASQGTRVTTQ